jgi:hypothetical protein
MNAGLVVLALLIGRDCPLARPGQAGAGVQARTGFRLFARASFRWIGNRTQCFLSASGQICTAESSTVGGGYWPANTGNQYIFNSGLQIAGIVDSASAGNSWAGDIEGAFFFNARGGGNGQQITTIYNSGDPADLAACPPRHSAVRSAGEHRRAAARDLRGVRRRSVVQPVQLRCRDRRRFDNDIGS